MDQRDADTHLILDHDSAIRDVVVDSREKAIERAREIAKTEGTVWIYVPAAMVHSDGTVD